MRKAVELDNHGAVAVITIDSPPVNALGQAVRQELLGALATALADETTDVLVVRGKGRLFSAGADITEFGDATRPPPHLREVVRAFDSSAKPVVAAIHGVALGGALELAMACHYRVSVPDARLGLSEVNFGVIPGAGGTQLLPRLIGAEKALAMITTGEPVDAREAADLGLVDRLIEGDLLAGALAFAREIAGHRPLPRGSQRSVHAWPAATVFEAARARVGTRSRGAQAPLLAIAAVRAAGELAFDHGLERERELWVQAASSPESAAMRHIFLAERAAANIPDIPKDTPVARIRKAAVIGSGTMGTGIAMALANVGIEVTLVGRRQSSLEGAMKVVGDSYEAAVKKGRLPRDEIEARRARIAPTTAWDGLAEVDLAIECVSEEMETKHEVFARFDALCRRDAILATSTSALNIDLIADAIRRPAQVVGLHFFSPAHGTKVIEVVRTERTASPVVAASMRLAKDLGNFGVLVRVGEGFVGSRMFHEYQREANVLLHEGAPREHVDAAMADFGMATGPLATLDQTDTDEMETVTAEASKAAGVEPRAIGQLEIVERCLFAMINEGARILDEGIALRASDIDVIWVDGYGFPRHRGGPMYHADRLGLSEIHDRLRRLAREHGEHWTPSPLLARLAREGRAFGTT